MTRLNWQDLCVKGIEKLIVYESGRPVDIVASEMGLERDRVIKLASNENALRTSPEVLKKIVESLSEIYRYPDGGAWELKKKLSEKLCIPDNCILPGNGSNEIIELIGHAFISPSVSVVVPQYCFIVYTMIAQLFGAEIRTVPVKSGFIQDLDGILDAIDITTRIVFLASPNNPTGTIVNPVDFDRFLTRLPDYVIVCLDEAYIEYVEPEKRIDSIRYIREGARLIVLRTFSKVYGLAGLRIGYAVADSECITLLNKVRQPFNVNSLAMIAAIAALEDTEHVKKSVEAVIKGRNFMKLELESMGLTVVESYANFVLVNVKPLVKNIDTGGLSPGRFIYERLLKMGVIVRPVDGYGLQDYVRITVGTQEENEICLRALRKIIKD